MNNKLLIAVVAAILLLGAGLIISQSGTKQQVSVVPTPAANPTQVASPTEDKLKEFVVEGKPFEYSLKEITVKKGDKVKITFKNTQGFHDLTIDQLDVKTKQIQAGEEDSLEFVADKAGTFEYFCSVGNHRQMGMVGKLIVEE